MGWMIQRQTYLMLLFKLCDGFEVVLRFIYFLDSSLPLQFQLSTPQWYGWLISPSSQLFMLYLRMHNLVLSFEISKPNRMLVRNMLSI